MSAKETVFQQVAALIAAVHDLHFKLTKDIPMNDITPLQYEMLELLSVKQPITLSQLSICKGISMPNTSREIKKLVEIGLCEKVGDAEDRRKQYIRLSPAGEERIAAAFAHMKERFTQQIADVSDQDLSTISEAMALLEATLFRSNS